MERIKECAFHDFCSMIEKSWTYARMTDDEKNRWNTLMTESVPVLEAVKGTYRQRFEVLHAVYDAYLIGIGYDGFNWRDKPKEDLHTIRNRHLQKITESHPFIGHPHY